MATKTTDSTARGRPRKAAAELRSERLSGIRLTTAERNYIEIQSERAGLSVPEFARRAMLGIEVKARRPRVADQLVREVNRIGVNLAQLLRAVHFGQTPLTADIEAALEEVRDVINKVAADDP